MAQVTSCHVLLVTTQMSLDVVHVHQKQLWVIPSVSTESHLCYWQQLARHLLRVAMLQYRVSQEECAILRESVPYVKVYRYNPKHLYPKLNGYGDNGQRKVRSCSGSMYWTCSADGLSHPAHVADLDQNEQSAKLNQYFNTAGFHMPCIVLGTLWATTVLVRVFM
jgi:hypothetical protein